MKLEGLFIVLILFAFIIFLFPEFETAIQDISGAEPLRPLFLIVPIGIIGAVFVAFFRGGD